MSNSSTQNVPLWLKVLLTLIMIISGVNTYLASVDDNIDKVSIRSAKGAVIIKDVKGTIQDLESDLAAVEKLSWENRQRIIRLESAIQNLKRSREIIRNQLSGIKKRQKHIIDLILKNSK